VSTVSLVANLEASFPCPRCHREVTERFYGPCGECREQLVASQGGEGHELGATSTDHFFEPKMNVVPNHVATKE
jgi:hypothetical protein